MMHADIPPRRLPLHRIRRCVALLTFFGAIAVLSLAWKEHTFILRSAAYFWTVSDALAPADAIIVLGGGASRPYAAAQLYRSGLAGRILVDDDDDRKLVLNLNVPPQDVVTFGRGLRNTYQEACALADWATKNAAQRFIIPTEPFPSRRVGWIFARKLGRVGAGAMIDVLRIPGYAADDWWLNSGGRGQFLSEIVKYLYYHFRYLFDQC